MPQSASSLHPQPPHAPSTLQQMHDLLECLGMEQPSSLAHTSISKDRQTNNICVHHLFSPGYDTHAMWWCIPSSNNLAHTTSLSWSRAKSHSDRCRPTWDTIDITNNTKLKTDKAWATHMSKCLHLLLQWWLHTLHMVVILATVNSNQLPRWSFPAAKPPSSPIAGQVFLCLGLTLV